MDWVAIGNDAWNALLRPVLAAAALAAIAFFMRLAARLNADAANWLKARRETEARAQLGDAAKDAVATVERAYVAPLRDPTTPGVFDEAAAIRARNMARSHIERTAPAALHVLEGAGAPREDIVDAKIERAVVELRNSMRPPSLPPVAEGLPDPRPAAPPPPPRGPAPDPEGTKIAYPAPPPMPPRPPRDAAVTPAERPSAKRSER